MPQCTSMCCWRWSGAFTATISYFLIISLSWKKALYHKVTASHIYNFSGFTSAAKPPELKELRQNRISHKHAAMCDSVGSAWEQISAELEHLIKINDQEKSGSSWGKVLCNNLVLFEYVKKTSGSQQKTDVMRVKCVTELQNSKHLSLELNQLSSHSASGA